MVWFILSIVFALWYSWWFISAVFIENINYQYWKGNNEWYWKIVYVVVILIQVPNLVKYLTK